MYETPHWARHVLLLVYVERLPPVCLQATPFLSLCFLSYFWSWCCNIEEDLTMNGRMRNILWQQRSVTIFRRKFEFLGTIPSLCVEIFILSPYISIFLIIVKITNGLRLPKIIGDLKESISISVCYTVCIENTRKILRKSRISKRMSYCQTLL